MSKRSCRLASALAALALLGLGGCGGSNSGPTPVPTPTPRPTPVTITITQGSFTGLERNKVLSGAFNTTVIGDLEAFVDWTFATNDLDLVLARGTRTCVTPANVVDFSTCTVVASETSTTNKPERMRVSGLATGNDTLYIANAGPDPESLSYYIQLTYTPSAGLPGASLSALPASAGETLVLPVRAWR